MTKILSSANGKLEYHELKQKRIVHGVDVKEKMSQ